MDAAILINDALSWIVSHPGRADMMPAPLNMLRPTAFRLRLWVERNDDAPSREFADNHLEGAQIIRAVGLAQSPIETDLIHSQLILLGSQGDPAVAVGDGLEHGLQVEFSVNSFQRKEEIEPGGCTAWDRFGDLPQPVETAVSGPWDSRISAALGQALERPAQRGKGIEGGRNEICARIRESKVPLLTFRRREMQGDRPPSQAEALSDQRQGVIV